MLFSVIPTKTPNPLFSELFIKFRIVPICLINQCVVEATQQKTLFWQIKLRMYCKLPILKRPAGAWIWLRGLARAIVLYGISTFWRCQCKRGSGKGSGGGSIPEPYRR